MANFGNLNKDEKNVLIVQRKTFEKFSSAWRSLWCRYRADWIGRSDEKGRDVGEWYDADISEISEKLSEIRNIKEKLDEIIDSFNNLEEYYGK